MTDRSSPPVGTLLDVVVLCFAKSELKELVGTDALRVVLESKQREIFPELDVMALQPVWELLESQEGFDKKKAFAPVCRIKSWEGRLKIRVDMPSTLDVLDEPTREKFALRCTASDTDLEKILRPATANTPVPLKRALTTGTMKAVERKTPSTGMRKMTGNGLTSKAKLAIAAAMISLVAAGVSAYLTFRGGKSAAHIAPTTEISDKVPLSDVLIQGTLIVGRLRDASWLDKPEEERLADLEATVPRLEARQATKLVVLDGKGSVVATVLVGGKPPVTLNKR